MLTSLEIKTIHNLPSVGENLTDHTVLGLSWLVNSIDTWDTAGPSVDSAISHLGWIRIPDNSSIFQFKGVLNPAAGKKLSALRDSFLQWIAWSDTPHRKLPDCKHRWCISIVSWISSVKEQQPAERATHKSHPPWRQTGCAHSDRSSAQRNAFR